ncbi:hypothetical protein FB567DRAFT_596958 [Paraphoma chrysanthemicola]|uniref:Uncharacterized protein n=1 Tax=Paraphoma chrysanthemicola TaxID=798071 RepID=A0A8K0QVE9_9PLEO|nr:hypothetical protein FB567DRAFT_596958 [Paraphoma chrysanthemicola]
MSTLPATSAPNSKIYSITVQEPKQAWRKKSIISTILEQTPAEYRAKTNPKELTTKIFQVKEENMPADRFLPTQMNRANRNADKSETMTSTGFHFLFVNRDDPAMPGCELMIPPDTADWKSAEVQYIDADINKTWAMHPGPPPPSPEDTSLHTIRIYFFPFCPNASHNNKVEYATPKAYRKNVDCTKLLYKDLVFPNGGVPEEPHQTVQIRDRLLESIGFNYIATLYHDQKVIPYPADVTKDYYTYVPPDTAEWKAALVPYKPLEDFEKTFGFKFGLKEIYFLGQDIHITACLAPARTPAAVVGEPEYFGAGFRGLKAWKASGALETLLRHTFTIDKDEFTDEDVVDCPHLMKYGSTECTSGECYLAVYKGHHQLPHPTIRNRGAQVAPDDWGVETWWGETEAQEAEAALGEVGASNLMVFIFIVT